MFTSGRIQTATETLEKDQRAAKVNQSGSSASIEPGSGTEKLRLAALIVRNAPVVNALEIPAGP
jgi:hypothetical protein